MKYVVLLLMAALTAGGVKYAERRLRGRPLALGLWFGLLGVIADSASLLSVTGYNIALSLADASFISAAMFFGVVPALVSGLIVVLEQALLPLIGMGEPNFLPLATLAVVLIAAAMREWFFDGERPYIVQAFALGVVFEAMHLSFDVLLSIGDLARSCEVVIAAFIPESAGIVVSLGLSSVALGRIGDFRIGLFSRSSRLLLAYLAVLGICVSSILVCAENDSRRMVKGSLRRLDHLFDSQLDCALHGDADWFAEHVDKSTDSVRLGEELKLCELDEVNFVDRNGVIIAGDNPSVIGFSFHDYKPTQRYLKLLEDSDAYVTEPFRRNMANLDGPLVKYVGVPLPDMSGFVQLGYKYNHFESEFKRYFFPLFEGVMNFFEHDYNIIVSTNDMRVALANGGHEAFVGRRMEDVGIYRGRDHARIDGEWCHVGWMVIGRWLVLCIVPLVEAYGEAMIISSVLVIMLFALVFGFRVVMLRFRKQQKKLDRLRAEADERRRQDMVMASKIQSSSLPMGFPSGDGFSFFARMKPAREVGGDFYDFFALKDGRVAFVIADVSGKGVPAAMFMMKTKGMIKSSMYDESDFAAAVAMANDRLSENNEAEMFVTAWIGIYDVATRSVEYVNAGHNPPLVKHAGGSVEWLRKRGGSALGVFPGCRYRVERFTLSPGDSLLLYTDGVTEAQDAAGGFYGEARLSGFLGASGTCFVDGLFADLAAFQGGAEQADDITAVALDIGR